MEEHIEKTIETYENTAEWYEDTHNDIEVMKKQADRFLDRVSGEKILDVGCGPGRDAEYFSEKGMNVTGIDLTERFLEIASEKVPEANFVKMDMREIEFKENSFDGIWCCASLLHIPKEEASEVLKQFHDVLEEEGIIFLAVKHGKGEERVQKDHYDGGEKFFVYYQQKEIENMVEDSGFEIISSEIEGGETSSDDWVQIMAKADKD
ncbi:MAG: class I SAM-dependent methyltransferase [Candidatus Nanosalina sp.]